MGLQCQKIKIEGKDFLHYYLCHYKPIRAGADKMSESLIRFKQGVAMHVKAWSDCAVQELAKNKLGLSGIIIRVKRSGESIHVNYDYDPLSILCRKLADAGDAEYDDQLLLKTRATVSLKALSWKEREREMKNVYQINSDRLKQIRQCPIMLIDDIYTSGATVRAILSALMQMKRKVVVHIFTLAYTDYGNELNSETKIASERYKFRPEFGWSMVEEESGSGFDFEILTRQILTDDFA